MTSLNTQIQPYPFIYARGVSLVYSSATTFLIGGGQVRDNGNDFDMFVNTTITVNTTLTGLNGLDTGTISPSICYYVYLIANSAGFGTYPTGAIISSSSTPILPFGYDLVRRIGFVMTDSSSNIRKFYQSGSNAEKQYQYDTPVSILSSGTSTSFLSASLPQIAPPQASLLTINASFDPLLAGDSFYLRTGGSSVSTANAAVIVSAPALIASLTSGINIMSGREGNAFSIDYAVASGGSLNLSLVGFTDSI